MNERIKELAEQAGMTQMNRRSDGRYVIDEDAFEKFAELVVKDCMAMCEELKEEYFKHRKNTTDFDEKHIYAEGEAACFNLRYKMKKRFGVEE